MTLSMLAGALPAARTSIWSDMWNFQIPATEKVLRTIGVYVAILVIVRLAGKRLMAQMNSLDLVVVLLLSNVVQNAVIGDDNSLTGGILGAIVLVAAVGTRWAIAMSVIPGLLAAVAQGLRLAVAARLEAAYAADCSALRFEGGRLLAVRPVYGGKALLTVAANGDLYATGRHYGDDYNGPTYTNSDILTLKLSPNGSLIWDNRYEFDGMNNGDLGKTLVVSNDGEVIVGGYSQRAGAVSYTHLTLPTNREV